MLHALVIDDDADVLEMVEIILAAHGIKAECLDHGEKLFESLSVAKPDLILMDIYLGTMDGRDISKMLKSSRQFRQIPIILYSAGQITAASIDDSLADAFVSKPFKISDLIQKINLVAGAS